MWKHCIPPWKEAITVTSHSAPQTGYHGKDRQRACFNHFDFQGVLWKMFKFPLFLRLKVVSHSPHVSLCFVQNTKYLISSVKKLLQIFQRMSKSCLVSLLFKFWIVTVWSDLEILHWPALNVSMHWDGVRFPTLASLPQPSHDISEQCPEQYWA